MNIDLRRKRIAELDFSAHDAASADPREVAALRQIERIDASDNELRRVCRLHVFTSLTTLQLARNQLAGSANDVLAQLPRRTLTALDLSENLLRVLHPAGAGVVSFADFPALRVLDLSRNELGAETTDNNNNSSSAAYFPPSLERLSLAHNGFRAGIDTLLRGCGGLRDLRLGHNAFASVEGAGLAALPAQCPVLASLELTGNPLEAALRSHSRYRAVVAAVLAPPLRVLDGTRVDGTTPERSADASAFAGRSNRGSPSERQSSLPPSATSTARMSPNRAAVVAPSIGPEIVTYNHQQSQPRSSRGSSRYSVPSPGVASAVAVQPARVRVRAAPSVPLTPAVTEDPNDDDDGSGDALGALSYSDVSEADEEEPERVAKPARLDASTATEQTGPSGTKSALRRTFADPNSRTGDGNNENGVRNADPTFVAPSTLSPADAARLAELEEAATALEAVIAASQESSRSLLAENAALSRRLTDARRHIGAQLRESAALKAERESLEASVAAQRLATQKTAAEVEHAKKTVERRMASFGASSATTANNKSSNPRSQGRAASATARRGGRPTEPARNPTTAATHGTAAAPARAELPEPRTTRSASKRLEATQRRLVQHEADKFFMAPSRFQHRPVGVEDLHEAGLGGDAYRGPAGGDAGSPLHHFDPSYMRQLQQQLYVRLGSSGGNSGRKPLAATGRGGGGASGRRASPTGPVLSEGAEYEEEPLRMSSDEGSADRRGSGGGTTRGHPYAQHAGYDAWQPQQPRGQQQQQMNNASGRRSLHNTSADTDDIRSDDFVEGSEHNYGPSSAAGPVAGPERRTNVVHLSTADDRKAAIALFASGVIHSPAKGTEARGGNDSSGAGSAAELDGSRGSVHRLVPVRLAGLDASAVSVASSAHAASASSGAFGGPSGFLQQPSEASMAASARHGQAPMVRPSSSGSSSQRAGAGSTLPSVLLQERVLAAAYLPAGADAAAAVSSLAGLASPPVHSMRAPRLQ